MATDPFSDILRLTDTQSVVTGGFTAGKSWAIRFMPTGKIKFAAIMKGRCWLLMGGVKIPVRVETGDVCLLLVEKPYVIASDLKATPVDAAAFFKNQTETFPKLNSGNDFFLIGGHVLLNSVSGGLLSDLLPPLIHVKATSPQSKILKWILDQLVQEQAKTLPGGGVASTQLSQLLFVQLLRAHLANSESFPAGLLRALGDPSIAPALQLVHGDPAKPWKLEELAKSSAMSRTTFALRFKTVAGVPPLTYLHHWRMRLAERALREEKTTVSVISQSLGYESESAFSNAFKKMTGQSPKLYRNNIRSKSN